MFSCVFSCKVGNVGGVDKYCKFSQTLKIFTKKKTAENGCPPFRRRNVLQKSQKGLFVLQCRRQELCSILVVSHEAGRNSQREREIILEKILRKYNCRR
jgi:hypothetical protein